MTRATRSSDPFAGLRRRRPLLKSIGLALTVMLSGGVFVWADDLPPSANPLIKKQEEETQAKLGNKKGKADERADALYDLAKVCFDNHDYARAEKYMKESLVFEQNLNRPERSAKTYISLAIVLALKKKNEEALAAYKSALDIAVKANLKEYISMVTDSLGTLALRTDNLDEADAYFKKAFSLGQADKNIPTQMTALVNQATVLRRKKDDKAALELLKQALALADQGEQDRALGLALTNLARVQHDMGDLQAAVSANRRAIEVFRQDLDVESQAHASWELAETFFDLQRVQEAKEYYQTGFDALKEEPDSDLKIQTLIGLGSAEAGLGHFEAAQKLHSQAYDIATGLKNKTRELEAVMQMGYDHLLNGFPEAGLYRLLDGEKLIDSGGLGAKIKGTFLIAIGRCYKELGQFEPAQKYYEEALKLFEDTNDVESQALSLNSLAVLMLDSKNKAEFERCYKAAKAIYVDMNDKRDLAILDYNYAQFMFTENKFAEAMTSYNSALNSIKGTGDVVSEGMILRGIGLASLYSGHPQQAMAYYERALEIADQSGQVEGQWDSHLGLGKSCKKLGLNDMAVIHLTKAVDLVEKERGRLTKDSFKTHNLDQRNDCFVELVDLFIRINRPYDALATAEKGRARAFLDMLSSRKGGRTVESFQAPISSRARPQETNAPKQMIAMAAEPGTRGVSVLPRASQIYSSSAVSPVNAAAPDIEEMKTLVKASKGTVLEYFILPDKIAVWVIDPDSTIHMLPPLPITKQQLSEKVSLAYEAITHQPKTTEEVQALGRRRQDLLRELSDLLIKPAEPFLPKDEHSLVTIVPHGPMFMIPFAALLTEDKKFLIERHTLAYTPAIGVMRATQKLEQTLGGQEDKLLALGNPITKAIAFLGALPYSEKEVRGIAALFGAANSVVKIGQDADKKTFEELAPKFSDVHLATHGLVDEEHPMQSSLILAPTQGDDGLLTVKDILAMKELKAKLVVLSACQTGRGKITGDGVVGLSRAFIIAGTPSVLVSQWNVDDHITEFQMQSFYKGYLAKSGKSKSLRQAQLDTIKFMEGSDYGKGGPNGVRANPRYWAAFQLIGES